VYICIAYDISNDRLRLRVSKMCRRIGLQRLQKSVFIGQTRKGLLAELEKNVRPILPASDQFVVIPLEKKEYHNILLAASKTALKDLLQKRIMKHF
jgi:CRISPR-associated protein Cas2